MLKLRICVAQGLRCSRCVLLGNCIAQDVCWSRTVLSWIRLALSVRYVESVLVRIHSAQDACSFGYVFLRLRMGVAQGLQCWGSVWLGIRDAQAHDLCCSGPTLLKMRIARELCCPRSVLPLRDCELGCSQLVVLRICVAPDLCRSGSISMLLRICSGQDLCCPETHLGC